MITLPLEWAKSNDLEKGDTVVIETLSGGSLLITPLSKVKIVVQPADLEAESERLRAELKRIGYGEGAIKRISEGAET